MSRVRIAAAALLAGSLSLHAQASRYTDLWSDPAESGWGMNLVQQEETAFVTLFVYGADERPLWYVASDARVVAYSNPGGLPVFSGHLYRMQGPWHGGAFDPARVHATAAGELHVEVLDVDRVRIAYTADGVTAVKELRRQTFAAAPHSATYDAWISVRVSTGEPPPSVHRYAAAIRLELEAGEGYMRTEEASGRVCEFRGAQARAGKLVRFAGAYACSAGEAPAGTFTVDDLEISANGFTGSLRISSGRVAQYGRFAGARR